MIAVIVDFEIKQDFSEQFLSAVCAQAKNSLDLEEECHRFDVCADPIQNCKICLYELYSDNAAFDAHLASKHFLSFDQMVKNWFQTKTNRVLQLL